MPEGETMAGEKSFLEGVLETIREAINYLADNGRV